MLDGLTKEEAEAQEVQLIAKYRSAEPEWGYNTSLGGKGTGRHSEETRRKLGNVRRGAHHTEEAKRKLSEAHTGKTLSEEHIAKLKEAQFGAKHHRARAVYQYTLDGEFVARFDCISDAARKVDAPNQNIVKCCQGKRAHAKGYRWEYV